MFRQTSKETTPCGDGDRNLSYIAISQGTPGLQEARRG